jgi:hypothetical protein
LLNLLTDYSDLHKDKLILSLCDFTGSWSEPYHKAGYSVELIDLKYGADVRSYRYRENVYGILAAPPCTDFTIAGAEHWEAKDNDGRTLDSLNLVAACCRIIIACNPVFWALENPAGGRLPRWLGNPRMKFDPCDFGGYLANGERTHEVMPPQDAYKKNTALWGKFNLPIQKYVQPIEHSDSSWIMRLGGSSVETKMLRSITPRGFAQAFFEANQ